MPVTISPYLLSTYQLLKSAFPNGIDEQSYYPLLALLYEEMSDRNLAEVISQYTNQSYESVLNDIYRVASTDISSLEKISKLREYLLDYDYQKWLEEG
ncbi:MAG TPA: DUF3349 domain-containing protein [Cyanothece sp. UBA12306]|nr:DUF3349 domain-containing protein [Cyanothece sp. UBA12306]